MKVTAVVPAAGTGRRIIGHKNTRKLSFIVKGRPILIHTLIALEKSRCINDIVLVVHADEVGKWRNAVKRFRINIIRDIIAGGRTRFESVKKGLLCAPEDSEIILIHDGARPLVDKRIISSSIKACAEFGAALCGVPAISTVKFVNADLTVKDTPERESIYTAQTPQVFRRNIALEAYSFEDSGGATDDAMLAERLGYKVKMVPGSYRNIKVTTPEDLVFVKEFLR